MLGAVGVIGNVRLEGCAAYRFVLTVPTARSKAKFRTSVPFKLAGGGRENILPRLHEIVGGFNG